MQILKHNILTLLIVILSGIIFFVWQNNSITITKSDYINTKIPKELDGFQIVHISDLHNKTFGKDQRVILDKIKDTSPDIIVITGDLIDRRRYDLDAAMTFIEGVVDIAPVYYVSGNHEAWSGNYPMIKESLINEGVHVLDDVGVEIFRQESSILIAGVRDPAFLTPNYMDSIDITEMERQLNILSSNDSFKILLSHRPELFHLYCENHMDLIFTGHAHGGQFRIPFIGGLAAPNQGLFPKYTSGSYTKDSTTMFISRGLGNSIMPIRIFNRPEIILVTLKTKA